MKNIKSLVRKNIINLIPYSCARDEFQGNEGTFLDANENPYGLLNRYPSSNQLELKSIVASQKNIAIENVFVGNGSDEAIDLLFRIFCEPYKDKCLVFEPTYGMYKVAAAINAIEVIDSVLDSNFDIDLNQIQSALNNSSIKLVFICSPNNPTGNPIARHKIEQILELTKGLVVIDEAYIDFSDELSCIELLDKYPNLVILQTMSKAYGLAAARIGFAFANKEIIQFLNNVKSPYNISSLNEYAAIQALTNLKGFERRKERVLQNKELLISELNKRNEVIRIYPSSTNFLLVEFIDADEIYNELIKREIIVRNRTKVIRNCLRITVGTKEENKVLINALKQIENEKSIIY